MRVLVSLGIAIGCGCGDDGDGMNVADAAMRDSPVVDAAIDTPVVNACGTPGVVNGTVMGVAIAPVVRAQRRTIGTSGVVIVLDEVAGGCGMNSTTGEHLVLGFCATPMPGTYPAVDNNTFSCPSSNTFGLVEQGGGMDLAFTTGGSVTITTATTTCVTGSFTFDYANSEQLIGSFNAEICP